MSLLAKAHSDRPIVTSATGPMEFALTLVLTEGEARALEALFGYGHEALLKVFYQMGTYYMQPYEQHMQSLGNKCFGGLTHELNRIDETRAAFQRTAKESQMVHQPLRPQ